MYTKTNHKMEGITEIAFEALVKEIRCSANSGNRLLSLLKDQNAVYTGKSAAAVNRMRGFVYYSFSYSETPQQALVYLYEELESGDNDYVIAAAALAIRHCKYKSQEMAGMLLKGLRTAINNNGFISFGHYFQKWPLENRTSPVEQVLTSVSWLGAFANGILPELQLYAANKFNKLTTANVSLIEKVIANIGEAAMDEADCCLPASRMNTRNSGGFLFRFNKRAILKATHLEDQDGTIVTLEQLFSGSLSLVAFFYTRCENPAKCSLTITNLAALQQKLQEAGYEDMVNITAISYDSFYDSPALLQKYGTARRLQWNGHTRMLRAVSDFSKLSDFFDLGVNFADTVVNRHAIELYLVNNEGEIVERFERSQMNNELILSRLIERVERDKIKQKHTLQFLKSSVRRAGSLVIPMIFALLPKCPFCLAAYLSVFGITGLQLAPYFKFLLPAMAVIMSVNLYSLYKMGVKKGSFTALVLCLSGSVIVVVSRYLLVNQFALILGLVLLFSGVVFNALPVRLQNKDRLLWRNVKFYRGWSWRAGN